MFDDEIESIEWFDPLTGHIESKATEVTFILKILVKKSICQMSLHQ